MAEQIGGSAFYRSLDKDSDDAQEYMGVTDEFAWYELTRMRLQVTEVAERLRNLQKTLKEQSDAQHRYFAHLQRKLSDLQAENAKLREGVTNV
jgi:chaperonin cofactor prefoldin